MLAARLCAITGDIALRAPDKAIVVCAADHGVARAGVSAYPPEVTAQMVQNFAAGGAAINVLARQAGARLVVADLGVCGGATPRGVRSLRVGDGTASFLDGPAMAPDAALTAIGHGAAIARELCADGVRVIGLGEMGIGNSTAAAAICAALCGCSVDAAVGRGTGVDDAGLARKRAAVSAALELHSLHAREPLEVLACVGGYEIAALAGVALVAAAQRRAVVLDGFIASAAALVAARMCPRAGDFMVASHRSLEPGHGVILEALRLTPLLDLELRLGEGTGAALAMPLIDAALAILQDMSTFESAGVSRRND
jgi:nicotinate-nucleotide--dimethylbenzimidazole phosphoribosyltransferase